MAILDRVIDKDRMRTSDEEVVKGHKPLYIGLTMLCCKECRNAVVAFNEVSAEGVKSGGVSTELVKDLSFQMVGVRGQHLLQFPWGPPEFFERRPAIAKKYAEITANQKSKGMVVPENPLFADNSHSDPEIDHEVCAGSGGGTKLSTVSKPSPLRVRAAGVVHILTSSASGVSSGSAVVAASPPPPVSSVSASRGRGGGVAGKRGGR